MTFKEYPLKRVGSCSLCEMGIVEAQRKDGLPGVHIFRCPCSPGNYTRIQHYPFWSEKFAENFIPLKAKRHGQNRKQN